MSYTTEGQPQGMAKSIQSFIREALISEIIAINQYSYHIDNSNCKQLVFLWKDIRDEEINHFNQFSELLRKYDPMQFRFYEEMKNSSPIDFKNCDLETLKADLNIPLAIRKDIKGECEAILLYEDVLSKKTYKDVYDVFFDIATDEKEHFQKLSDAISDYEKQILRLK